MCCRFPYLQLGTSCTLKSLVFVICVSFSIFATRYELCSWKSCICNMCFVFHFRNSVRVVFLKAPRWRAKWAYVGIKWPHEMNPERVQLFLICHVIGKNKTRTGFENHTLSLPRGRLVPRQPRAFKSITATQLHYRLISRLLSYYTFKSITAM